MTVVDGWNNDVCSLFMRCFGEAGVWEKAHGNGDTSMGSLVFWGHERFISATRLGNR